MIIFLFKALRVIAAALGDVDIDVASYIIALK